MYDKSVKELAPLFTRYARKFDQKHLVCAYRTTGGYESSKKEILRIFTNDRAIYYSSVASSALDGVISVTGIACEENFTDYQVARQLLKEAQTYGDIFEYKIEDENGVDDSLWIESSEFMLGEAHGLQLTPERLSSKEVKLLNYWLRNRLVYCLQKNVVLDNRLKVTEFDISVHQALTREKLFSWNRFRINKTKYGT